MRTNKGIKKVVMLFTMMLVLLTSTLLVNAASKPVLFGNGSRLYYTAKNQKKYNKQPLYYIQKGDKITKMQSSNKSVATIYTGTLDNYKYVMVNLKKPGKTKFTVWVKRGKTTYKLSKTVTVYKSNAFKTVKIGNSKNYAALLNGYHAKSINAVKGKAGKLSGKLTITMNNGWKIKSIKLVTSGYKNDEYYETARTAKNGSAITLRAGEEGLTGTSLLITYMNTRTKQTDEREIFVQ